MTLVLKINYYQMKFKHTKTLSGIILFSVLFFSCSNDEKDIFQEEELVKVNIRAGISTSSYDAEWAANDAIGIAMLDYQQRSIIDNIYNYRYYTPSGSESFIPSSADQVLYYPWNGARVYFKAYYPYLANLSPDMTFPVSVEDQSDLPAIDVMTGSHLSGFSRVDPDADLRMYHRLSKLIFRFTYGEGLEGLPGTDYDVIIHGMKITGVCDILNDIVHVENNVKDIYVPDRGLEKQTTGIVMPRPAGRGVTFDFSFTGGRVFEAAMSDTLQLLSGHKYTFYIRLEASGDPGPGPGPGPGPDPEVATIFRVDIEDWIAGPDSWIVAQ